jgi:hypothetical protein
MLAHICPLQAYSCSKLLLVLLNATATTTTAAHVLLQIAVLLLLLIQHCAHADQGDELKLI